MDRIPEIMKKLEAIKNLPTLPVIISKLNKAIGNENSDAKQIARIIEDDPAIMARILKVVNSAFYAASEPIASVNQAVARIGLKALSNIAMSTAVFSSFGKSTSDTFNREEFWRHSICTGIAANVIYQKARKNLKTTLQKELLHLSGLIHDMGKVIHEQYFHDLFCEALKVSARDAVPLFQAESMIIGIDHSLSGEWLGKKWRLDENILQVIRFHHEPDNADAASWELVGLIHVANYVCNQEKIGISGDSKPAFMPHIWKKLGMTINDIPEVIDRVHEESAKSEVLLALTK